MFILGEKFWSKVNKTNNCWNWIGGKSSKGYGRLRIGKSFFSPHRMVMNCVDSKIDVCHKCDNPSCVNPEHLFLGTRSDNMMDASRKGKLIRPKIYKTSKERRKAGWARYYKKHGKELQERRKLKRKIGESSNGRINDFESFHLCSNRSSPARVVSLKEK